MNLDEMKNLWQGQQAQTEKSNEQLIRSMLTHRSTDAVERMMNVEYLNLSVCALVLLVLLISIPLFAGSAVLVSCVAVSLAIGAASVAWCCYKVSLLKKLQFASSAVAAVAEQLERFRITIAREKMVSMLIAPLLMAALIPLAHRLVRGSAPVDYVALYGVRLLLGYIAYVVLALLWYGRLYARNISAINRHLEEIRAFRL